MGFTLEPFMHKFKQTSRTINKLHLCTICAASAPCAQSPTTGR